MKIGAILAAAAVLSVVAAARAEEVSVIGDRCSPVVRVAASNVPLSDVLRHVAVALDFDLAFQAHEDPSVTIDASRNPVDLLMTLAERANISIAQQRDVGCASGKRITKVWILPQTRVADMSASAMRARPLVSKAALAHARMTSDGDYWLITSEPSADASTSKDLTRPTVFSTEEP